MLFAARHTIAVAVLALAARVPALAAQQPAAGNGPPRWERREAMVPMRDGVRLFTVVMIPRNSPGPLPILLTRTPYGAGGWGEREDAPRGLRELAADGYAFAFQDIRGRNRSEGRFLMNRPLRPRGDTTGTDEATDAWDAVDWLVKNVPNNNGRVGIFGVSYPGWLAEVPLAYPHPALKAVSPQAPMTDTWMGDDFFHQGAFRMSYGFEYSWGMEGQAAGLPSLPINRSDAYDWYLSFPSLRDLTERTDAMRLPTWRHFVEHPAYDRVWQARAFQRSVRGVSVPTLTVGGWWDQEDIYGPTATYAALERFDTAGVNGLVMGPWSHGQWSRPGGDSLGNVAFGSATADSFRLDIEAPWFRHWLRGEGTDRFPDAQLFDAGTGRWRSFDRWPPPGAVRRSLFLRAGGRLAFDPPAERAAADSFVSDPANPVPYRPRPIEVTYGPGSRWSRWMTEDQRFVSGRADVVSWQSEPLAEDVVVAGPVAAKLFAETSGSDADWVVKLIDVYPDSASGGGVMAGYELMIAGEILRGRYREGFEHPAPIPSNTVEEYTVDLHPQFHTFRRGHRLMVQVQSSWFPLYDRNPQTYVPNIFEAPAAAFRRRTHRIVRTALKPSHLELLVLPQ